MPLNKHQPQLGRAPSPEGLEGFRRGDSARDKFDFIKIKKLISKSPSVENNPYYPFQPFGVAKLAGDFDKWVV
jgi:hypothetical protein